MANEEQLPILKEGMSGWNEWREQNVGAKIDLSGAVPRGVLVQQGTLCMWRNSTSSADRDRQR